MPKSLAHLFIVVVKILTFSDLAWCQAEGVETSEKSSRSATYAWVKASCEDFNKIAKGYSHMLCGSDLDTTVSEIKFELDTFSNSSSAQQKAVIKILPASLLPMVHEGLEDFIAHPYSSESSALLSQRLSPIGMAVSLAGNDSAMSRWTTIIQRINFHTLALAQFYETNFEYFYEHCKNTIKETN